MRTYLISFYYMLCFIIYVSFKCNVLWPYYLIVSEKCVKYVTCSVYFTQVIKLNVQKK